MKLTIHLYELPREPDGSRPFADDLLSNIQYQLHTIDVPVDDDGMTALVVSWHHDRGTKRRIRIRYQL